MATSYRSGAEIKQTGSVIGYTLLSGVWGLLEKYCL